MAVRKSVSIVILIALVLACAACGHARGSGPDDRQIAADVRSAIGKAVSGANFIQVSVDRGIVTLNGQVRSETERRQIGDAANAVRGVRSVINNITLP